MAIRSFLAFELPPEVKEVLSRISAELRPLPLDRSKRVEGRPAHSSGGSRVDRKRRRPTQTGGRSSLTTPIPATSSPT